ANNTVSYSISGGADAALFAIDSATGALSFLAAPDYETDPHSYADQVKAPHAPPVFAYGVPVGLTDVNDNTPQITPSASFSLADNGTPEVTAFPTRRSSDLANNTVSYSISGGADAALFAIDSATGALSFLAAPDYETDPH